MSLDDVIKQKKKSRVPKVLGIKKKTFKTLKIKKSQLKGVNLSNISSSRKTGLLDKNTPNKPNQQRYFSMNSQLNTSTPSKGKT
ncbi:hypothetical protein, partial [Salmonella sp. s51228]|uniref:hypothetical protein n=1 Tax=Salmonella sp. s51228 TaxID=3159652 RepID=UPI003980A757